MDGIIIINKEKNWTSNDIVQKLKGIFHEKVGHTGTLDPQATGVLPILIGKGTNLSKYLINHDKEYIATIKLGTKTSTADGEGKIIETKNVSEIMLEEDYIKKVLESFIGNQTQIPPMYSAIKVNGKKLYDYARKGQKVEVQPRNIKIYDIKLVGISKEEKEITYKVRCSKGTYIRTLSENIAEKLGTVGFMKNLNRTMVGEFLINQAIKISEVEEILKNGDNIEEKIITVEKFFENKPRIELNDNNLKKFLNGVLVYFETKDGVYKIYNKNIFVGSGVIRENKLKRDIITLIG